MLCAEPIDDTIKKELTTSEKVVNSVLDGSAVIILLQQRY